MKKVLLASVLLSVLVGLGTICRAEDLTGLNEAPTQVIEIEKSGAVAILQKQPINKKQTQVIKVKKAGGFLLIQINGKVKDFDTGLQNRK
jgi:hypothetical protein|nr:MAG TPA_asm: hypothetical protein [Caudoviricetes sp.]